MTCAATTGARSASRNGGRAGDKDPSTVVAGSVRRRDGGHANGKECTAHGYTSAGIDVLSGEALGSRWG